MSEEERRYVQLQHWRCCQLCGQVVTAKQAKDDFWLVSPYKDDPSMTVVRCPLHISEWSLRQSSAGRTSFWRQKMREGKLKTAPLIPPHASPFPMTDRKVVVWDTNGTTKRGKRNDSKFARNPKRTRG